MSIKDGQMQVVFTYDFNDFNSILNDSSNPIAPNFDAQLSTKPLTPTVPAADAIVTICPS